MKKEVLIAIVIGFGLGLVITFGIWSANKALKETAPNQTLPTPQISLTPTPTVMPAAFSLTVTSPQQNSISNKDAATVKGSTSPKAVLVILFEKGEKIFEADSEGNFSTEVGLTSGANEIKIRAYDKQGNEAEKTLTVVYSTAEI